MSMSVAHVAKQKEYSHFDLAAPNPNSGKWELDFINITAFFIERGFFIFRTSVDKWIMIRIVDNIVKQVGKKDLKDELVNYVSSEHGSRYMHQFFLKNISKALSDEFLETLPEKKVEFRKDIKNAMQIYYQNCIVKITNNKVQTFPYSELNGFIWESQILPREFNEIESEKVSDFKRFIFNISNEDDKRYFSVCSMIGFLIHNFKNPAYCPAIILNDEVISDHPEGGTGKGLLLKAVEQYVNTVTLEGKTFTFDKSFVYQQVNADSKLISFQDVNKSFDFERLFSVLTDGIDVEKKGQSTIHYDFHESPKVVITTNYAIKGSGNSHERRRHELEIAQYYNKSKTPFSEFKKMMFHDWTQEEWHQFDAFISYCCQFYLINGLVSQTLINLPEKRLLAETSYEFIEFMEDNKPAAGNRIERTKFYDMFKTENPTSRIASKTFYNYVRLYVDFHHLPFAEIKHVGIKNFQF